MLSRIPRSVPTPTPRAGRAGPRGSPRVEKHSLCQREMYIICICVHIMYIICIYVHIHTYIYIYIYI